MGKLVAVVGVVVVVLALWARADASSLQQPSESVPVAGLARSEEATQAQVLLADPTMGIPPALLPSEVANNRLSLLGNTQLVSQDILNRKDFPAPRSDHTLTSRGNEAVYVFGGMNDDRKVLGDFWRFSFESKEWLRIGGDGSSPPPAPRCWHATALKTDRSKLFVFGGYNSTHDLNDLWRYSFIDNQWRLIKPNTNKPLHRDRHSMVAFENSLIVFGGYNGEFMNDMWRYSIDDNGWTVVEASAPSSGGPSKRRSHSAATSTLGMYMYGGNNKDRVFDDLWFFSFSSSTWALVAGSRSPARRCRGRLAGDGLHSLYLFGGYDGANFKFDLWHFDDEEGWEKQDPNNDRPVERADFGMSLQRNRNPVDKGRLYVFGGFDGQDRYADLYQYEISSNEWILLFSPPTAQ